MTTQNILDTVVNKIEELLTEIPLLPEGDYQVQIGELSEASGTKQDGAQWVALKAVYKLIDPSELKAIGRDSANLYDFISLSLDDTGAINFNNTITLNRIIKASGMADGESLRNLTGRYMVVAVVQATTTKDGIEKIINRIVSYAPLS